MLRRRLVGLLGAALIGMFAVQTTSANAETLKPGARCSVRNKTRTIGSKKYKCIKAGKKLVWDKGTRIPTSVSTKVTATTMQAAPTTATTTAMQGNEPERALPSTTVTATTIQATPTNSTAPPTTTIPPESPPHLSAAPVDLTGTYDPVLRRLGSLNCSLDGGLLGVAQGTCFSPFGFVLSGQSIGLPHYSYRLVPGGNIYAVADGIIDRVEKNVGWSDYEISTVSRPNGVYGIIYDHVDNVRVAIGSTVKAGDVIATIATDGFFELQINKDERSIGGRASHVCPWVLGSTRFNELHEAALSANNTGNPTSTFPSVCLVETINP